MRGAVARYGGLQLKGRVVHALGSVIKAVVPDARVGEICLMRNPGHAGQTMAEIVGIAERCALLTPLGDIGGISATTEVTPTRQALTVPVGHGLLGRIVDGFGRPLDEPSEGPLRCERRVPVLASAPDPLKRSLIRQPLQLGIRALDGFLTCGIGQRLGIFAAAGVGKSTLTAMMVKRASVDVRVVALIGERGREVREFIEQDLDAEARRSSVVVCATGDRPAVERAKAAYVATAIAEYFRDQGQRVLLVMDSITRYARAQREIALAAGEPPTRRGFPPSVFAALPRLLERAGTNERGSITAIYTVLVEGDDMTEPIADEVRSILDGHIVLSQKLAAASQYPAIDILSSASRLMHDIVDADHLQAAARLRDWMARHEELELLLRVGEYQPGADPAADQAVAKMPAIRALLRQPAEEDSTLADTVARMVEIAEVHAGGTL
jgi:type III secretion protein N (ATPase)